MERQEQHEAGCAVGVSSAARGMLLNASKCTQPICSQHAHSQSFPASMCTQHSAPAVCPSTNGVSDPTLHGRQQM